MSQERIDNLFASESWTSVYTAFSNVSLKSYDFDTIRESLIAYINKTYPEKFNDFIASSEFIAILDLVAYLGHSLAFRSDMNTRENFMDTAERRESILRMARTLGYTKTRPINASGMMKITSVTTTEDVADNEGNSLAGNVVNWNDSNDVDWYEKFITVLNSSFNKNTKIQDPSASLNIGNVENYLYEVNENKNSKSIAYAFTSNVAGANRRFEAVRASIENNKIIEGAPLNDKNFTIINRNDNLGPASDRTGFFVLAKAGQLQFENFRYGIKASNRVETLTDANVSNTDVWLHKLDSNLNYKSDVTKVDNDTRETAIYNSLRTGNGDLVNISTGINNTIELRYPDGIFGNAAFGDYRAWFRTCTNENFSVNSGDISNVTISIPYTGADDKSYRLTITMASTKDFGENFAGETFTSVRRIAQKSYYAQDRMVNAQDYNVYPLTLGNNIVRKLKSVNTSFAGNSRYFEMDDVTGHHSNLSITGTDGSVFVEDESLNMSLYFNRTSGNSDDFIRNELSRAIGHPSLFNKFYHLYRDAASINIDVNELYTKSPLNNLQIEGTAPWNIEQGDYVKILGESSTEYYARVKKVVSTDPGQIILDRVITEKGTLKSVIRGYRSKFTEAEITAIKTQKIDDLNVTSFTLYYDVAQGQTTKWEWKIWDGVVDLSDKIKVEYEYNPGIRTHETMYVAKINGKKVVFESYDQVRFYYGNNEVVVDNETNLAERDKLLINYYDGAKTVTSSDSNISDEITVGYTPVSEFASNGSGGGTFKAKYRNTGADVTYDYVENNSTISTVDYKHQLVSPAGITYDLPTSAITSPATPNNIIGSTPDFELELEVDDLSQYVSLLTNVEDDSVVTTGSETHISPNGMPIDGEQNAEAQANAVASHSTISSTNLKNIHGFKGEPSLSYFGSAPTTNNFLWIDTSSLPTGETRETATFGMTGVQKDFITEYLSGTSSYKFTYPYKNWNVQPDGTGGDGITQSDTAENDVRFKQTAYGEINFSTSETITQSNMVIKDNNGQIISSNHCELVAGAGNSYKIIFWTIDPGTSSLLDVFVGDGSATTTLADFGVKVVADVQVAKKVEVQTSSYVNTSAYVYDEYRISSGYIDPTRVKLLTLSADGNPYGLLNVFNLKDDQGNVTSSKFIIESYKFSHAGYENIDLHRASKSATAAPNAGTVSNPTPEGNLPSYKIWFNTDDSEWYLYQAGTWKKSFVYYEQSPTVIWYGDTQYSVVDGKSFVEDKFMSYRWDHYADVDKRIDPSTSNIVDMYVLTSDYVRQVNQWIAGGFKTAVPTSPNNYELSTLMSGIEPKSSIADHISYIPVKFKYLFGNFASPENQATFKVVKKSGTAYTDSEVKTAVSTKVNEYFELDNWEFGDTFYFSELASYLHNQLGDYIASVVTTPKYSTSGFTDLLSITSEPNEIFLSVTTSENVKIISAISSSELQGEDVVSNG